MIDRLRLGFQAALLLLIAANPLAAAPPDEEAIRAVEQRQEQAWNAHDARAYAALFAEDADVVTAHGSYWKGRAEAERNMATAFAGSFAQSRLRIEDVSVRPLADDLVLAHVRWSMTGTPDARGSAGAAHGLQSQVLRHVDGRWLIIAYQNTGAPDEAALPRAGQPAVPEPEHRGCWVANKDGKCLISKGSKG